jgi:ribosome-associated translation inhibitor RaiA
MKHFINLLYLKFITEHIKKYLQNKIQQFNDRITQLRLAIDHEWSMVRANKAPTVQIHSVYLA